MNQETVERAARALFDDNPVWHLRDDRPALWGEVKESAKDRYRQQARTVIAAIHPTVDSVEELDALPDGSVVLDSFAATCTKISEGNVFVWRRVTPAVERAVHWHTPYIPATVLHMGGAV